MKKYITRDFIFFFAVCFFWIGSFYLIDIFYSNYLIINKKTYSAEYRLSPADNETSDKDKSDSSSNSDNKNVSYFNPKSERNPFLSPVDYEKIRFIQEEEKRKRLEELRQKEGIKNNKNKYVNPVYMFKLQGIVGKYAIINGEMVLEGGYYKKVLKVLKVRTSYVIVLYKGKKYRLNLK